MIVAEIACVILNEAKDPSACNANNLSFSLRFFGHPYRMAQNDKRFHTYDVKFTMEAKDFASRLAPPTSAPSSSSCAINPLMLSGFTLPP